MRWQRWSLYSHLPLSRYPETYLAWNSLILQGEIILPMFAVRQTIAKVQRMFKATATDLRFTKAGLWQGIVCRKRTQGFTKDQDYEALRLRMVTTPTCLFPQLAVVW